MLGGNVFRVRDAPVTAVFLADLEPSKRIDKIMSIEKSYRAPEYNAMMPLAAGYFTGEVRGGRGGVGRALTTRVFLV
jgi:hypothetical protein